MCLLWKQEEIMNCTIFVPTFNRGKLLNISLRHLVKEFAQVPIEILVLDGSTDGCAESNRALCEQLNISYRHYPADISVRDRLIDGVQRITTPFASMGADDDFLFAPGYIESLAFLKANKDYTAAHGSYVERLARADGSIYERPIYTNACPTHSNSRLERGYDYLANYIPISYAIHPTDVLLQAIVQTAKVIHPQDLTLGELYPAILTVLKGKIQKFDIPYCSRIRQGGGYTPSWKFIHQPHFSTGYQRVKQALRAEFGGTIQNDDLFGAAVDMMFNAFWGKTDHQSKERFMQHISNIAT